MNFYFYGFNFLFSILISTAIGSFLAGGSDLLDFTRTSVVLRRPVPHFAQVVTNLIVHSALSFPDFSAGYNSSGE